MDDKLIDKIRSFRIQNKFKKHDARNEKYQELYDKHERIKEETVAKIDSGEITDDSQLKGVNKQLQRLRNRMGRIEKRDLKSAEKVQKIMDKRTYSYKDLPKVDRA
jgi:hypothetical protein|tara:strand:+ start:208 stop:525 length:318 start_codon:yes stop_codon:yes gene_type:complete